MTDDGPPAAPQFITSASSSGVQAKITPLVVDVRWRSVSSEDARPVGAPDTHWHCIADMSDFLSCIPTKQTWSSPRQGSFIASRTHKCSISR